MKLKPEQEVEVVAVMKGLKLFTGCTQIQLRFLVTQMDLQVMGKNKVVIMEQEISKTLYVIVKGSVGIWRRVGGEKKLVATLKAPDFFGETSMFSEAPANALVKVQDDAQLLTLSRSAFDDLVSKDGALGLLIERNMEEIQAQRPPLIKPASESENH